MNAYLYVEWLWTFRIKQSELKQIPTENSFKQTWLLMYLEQIYGIYNGSSNLSNIDGEWQWMISPSFPLLEDKEIYYKEEKTTHISIRVVGTFLVPPVMRSWIASKIPNVWHA